MLFVMAAPLTPRRIYLQENVCVICGFCFETQETTTSGDVIVKKLNNLKLKLTAERVQNIEKVIESKENFNFEGPKGICVKCNRSIERVLRLKNEIRSLTEHIKDANTRTMRAFTLFTLALPSPTRGLRVHHVEKRLARSPASEQPRKLTKFPSNVLAVVPVEIKEFQDITPRDLCTSHDAEVQLPEPSQQLLGCVPIAPIEENCDGQNLAISTFGTTIQNEKNKPTKRALFSSGNEESNVTGKIQLIDYFKSGAKTKWITDDHQKKYCKVLFRDRDVEEGLLKIIISRNPNSVVSAAANVINSECENICKRNSGSILIDKTHENIMQFTWDKLHRELQLRAPNLLKVFSTVVSPIPKSVSDSKLHHALLATAICLQGRFREMTALQYLMGFVMLHGNCTQRDIERLSKIGMSVHPQTLRNKLESWHELLDRQLLQIKNDWSRGLPTAKYQLVGDNWDRNIVPSYRTTQQKTISIHLFNVIGVVDRVVPQQVVDDQYMYILDVDDLEATDFIPSEEEQDLLENELAFMVANSVINSIEQMSNLLRSIYPDHYEHAYSHLAGLKTKQFSLGLYECDEKKTGEVIKLLKELSDKYVPIKDEDVYEPVFFGGDRLTDERIQAAQSSMVNGEKSIDRLEGFISKIEDFHRLMNFLEAIVKLTYSTESGKDPGTAYYFRNKLNSREVKAEVKNSYRPYKLLYYTLLDAVCCVFFLKEFGLTDFSETIPIPEDFHSWDSQQKISWMTEISRKIVRKWFFEDSDLLAEVRTVLVDPDHPENYWVKCLKDGRFQCHFCDKSYVNVDSLSNHEKVKHGHKKSTKSKPSVDKDRDELYDYILLLFRLCALHRNLDSAVDMGDGPRSVRSAKYETPLYNKTGKTKYLIGSIHLTSLTSGTLSNDQIERLVHNRFINVSGGKNRNMALDEYVEILNREIKNASTGFQTQESIIKHSKDFPFLINNIQHFDDICNIRGRKGFHHMPSYQEDVKIVTNELISLNALEEQPGRQFHCRKLAQNRNPFASSFQNLPLMILRHKPTLCFRRVRNRQV